MKKIGIVGGIAWLSTVDYYTAICELSERHHAAAELDGPARTPEMSIESLDLRKAVSLLGAIDDEQSWRGFDAYHREALSRLEAAGADCAILASNTPHHRFASITRGIRIPVINIFDAAAKHCATLGIREIAILGTALTMNSTVLRDAFATHQIGASAPSAQEQRSVIQLIADLQSGTHEGAAERLSEIARALFAGRKCDRPAVCLACTELPLAFPESKKCATFEFDGITYVNTLAIHARAAFDFAIK